MKYDFTCVLLLTICRIHENTQNSSQTRSRKMKTFERIRGGGADDRLKGPIKKTK